ncbi:hypothetical protein AMURIS_03672 [Acetatifactor muris]|uniref:CopG family transcriptional regulator n=1 Tax=Acetatifactor muris TaxID=879566 RepID=A0A2K4ZKD0_9FIRM|nr:hypothetical protein AMURIS_03672 [Acetatifactor muris]
MEEVLKLVMEDRETKDDNGRFKEDFSIRITEAMLYDRLHTLSNEYSVSVELLVNIAVKRLLSDIDFVRNLRMGKIDGE